jgi:hypothetical protein
MPRYVLHVALITDTHAAVPPLTTAAGDRSASRTVVRTRDDTRKFLITIAGEDSHQV